MRYNSNSQMDKIYFKFIALPEAREFIRSLMPEIREKVYYNIRKVSGGIKDRELFKKLEGTEIWEFRTLYKGSCYRLFAFWDKTEETFVIATHGIIKKTQKTPLKEISKAEQIRKEYLAKNNS